MALSRLNRSIISTPGRASRTRTPASAPRRRRSGSSYGYGGYYPASVIRNPYSLTGGSYGLGGGLNNLTTGLGGPRDHTTRTFFTPTYVTSRYELEVFSNQSWAARKLIEIIPDDCLVRWRNFIEDPLMPDEETIARFTEAEEKWNLRQVIGTGMKAGRLFGTALTVMQLKGTSWDMPLDPAMVRPGDLIGFKTFDRWDCRVAERDEDLMSPTYGMPLVYEIFPNTANVQRVHATRVLRFDGLAPLVQGGWDAYDTDWGVSVLVPCASAILRQAIIYSATAHLSQEASMLLLKMQGFRDFMGGEEAEEEGDDPDVYMHGVTYRKSAYRTMLIDADDEAERLNYNFANIHNIEQKAVEEIAASADVPMTRFMGQSPGGLDATGNSDMKNYALLIAGTQARMLTVPVMQADMVIARDAGMQMPPRFEWLPLVDLTDQERAEISVNMQKALSGYVGSFIMTEDEARERAARDPNIGPLVGPAPDQPEPDLGMPGGGGPSNGNGGA